MSGALRIAYFGLPLGAHLLSRDGHELALAVLSPLPAPGRRRLQRLLGEHVIDTLNASGTLPEFDAKIESRLDELELDLLVSWFWTRRLPLGWLEKPRLGAIGAHPSLLPRHRGPNPYYAAIDSGDVVTGVSIHRLTAAYDEGNVLLRSELPVAGKNSWQLARALDRPSLRRLRQAVAELAGDQVLAEQAQDENMATWAPEPEGQALRADFRWPAAQVWRRLQALSPVPGLALEVAGIALFATRARLTDDFPKALLPGEAAVVKDSTLVIRCGDRAIAIERATLGQNADLPQSSEGSELDERTLGRLIASRLTESG